MCPHRGHIVPPHRGRKIYSLFFTERFERRISLANKPITITNKSRALMIRETITSYLFLAPFLVFFVLFVIYPMFMCVYTSFFDATMGREDIFPAHGGVKERGVDAHEHGIDDEHHKEYQEGCQEQVGRDGLTGHEAAGLGIDGNRFVCQGYPPFNLHSGEK